MDLQETKTVFPATVVLVVEDSNTNNNGNNRTSKHTTERRNKSEAVGKFVSLPPRQHWMMIKRHAAAHAMTTNNFTRGRRHLPSFVKIFKVATILFGMLLAVVFMVVLLSSFILQINNDKTQNQDPFYRYHHVSDFNYIGSAITPPSVTPSKYPQQQQQSNMLQDGDGDLDSVVNGDKMNSHPCCHSSQRAPSTQKIEFQSDYCLLKTAYRPCPRCCSSLSSPTTRRY